MLPLKQELKSLVSPHKMVICESESVTDDRISHR
jgi:hypothetical protein